MGPNLGKIMPARSILRPRFPAREHSGYVIGIPLGMNCNQERQAPSVLMKTTPHRAEMFKFRLRGSIRELNTAYLPGQANRHPQHESKSLTRDGVLIEVAFCDVI